MSAPDWLTEGAHPVRKAQIERDHEAMLRRSRASRSMEAGNLFVGQFCVNLLEGRDPFDGVGK